MFTKQLKPFSRGIFVVFLVMVCAVMAWAEKMEKINFFDDFESGGGKWDFLSADRISVIDSGDPAHGNVLSLRSGGPGVYALIKDSHHWTNIRVEGEVYFPYDYYHYLGLIYNYRSDNGRTDFGSIFLLGTTGADFDSYYKTYAQYQEFPPDEFLGNVILVNPHRDSNASRLLYSEYWVSPQGEGAFRPREWHRFKAEILGRVCHFYVGDMKTPKITFDYFEYDSGRVGFKPRFMGSETRVDNVRVTAIKELSYKGPRRPEGIEYKPERLLTRWHQLGPFGKRIKAVEDAGYVADAVYPYQDKKHQWTPYTADPRGCVEVGRVSERYSGNLFVYYHTTVHSPKAGKGTFTFSTSDPLVVWVNKKKAGEVKFQRFPWYDFLDNPDHAGQTLTVDLKAGDNEIVILAKAYRYGGDGFFAHFAPAEEKKETKQNENKQKN